MAKKSCFRPAPASALYLSSNQSTLLRISDREILDAMEHVCLDATVRGPITRRKIGIDIENHLFEYMNNVESGNETSNAAK